MNGASCAGAIGQLARYACMFAALVAGCSSTHGPESADTATSWLRACLDDGECTGASRCVEHLCSIPCATNQKSCRALAAQARCEQPAGASQSLCDLSCQNADDCALLGSDYACQEGQCRPRGALEISSQVLSLMDYSSADERWPAMEPLTTWAGDRFRVAIAGRTTEKTEPISVLEVSELLADGRLVTQGPPAVEPRVPEAISSGRPLAINGEGTIAGVTQARVEPGVAGPQILHFLLPDGREPPTLVCEGEFAVAPVMEGSDWLVLCRGWGGPVTLGRYDPLAARWSLSPRSMVDALSGRQAVKLSVRGEDALLVWENDSLPGSVARVLDAAGINGLPIEPPRLWWELDAGLLPTREGSGYYVTLGVNGSWLVPSWTEIIQGPNDSISEVRDAHMQDVVGFRVMSNGATDLPVKFRLSVAEETMLDAVQGLPEKELVAFCFEDHFSDGRGTQRSELYLSIFDEGGSRVIGPYRLNRGASVTFGCRLSWSGSHLLATWIEFEDADPSPGSVNARLFSVR